MTHLVTLAPVCMEEAPIWAGASCLGSVWAGGLPSGLGPPIWAEGLPFMLANTLHLGWAICVGWELSVWAGAPIWVRGFQPEGAEVLL